MGGVSKARVVITAVVVEGRSQAEVARAYGVSKGRVSKLVARYRAEGEAAFEPWSRSPHTSPNAIDADTVERIVRLRKELAEQALDAGPDTIACHLRQHHGRTVSRATISRYLTRRGLVVPEPNKRPRSSYIRFQAALPNETWQADVTHYRLAGGSGTEILSWLDDHSRYALSVTAHARVTGPIMRDTFRAAVAAHGVPALTGNGMVFTTRLAGGRNAFEHELRRPHVRQKNSTPNRPATCGKVEHFQQTMKNWLRAQPRQPATRPACRRCSTASPTSTTTTARIGPYRTVPTPAAVYAASPKALPDGSRGLIRAARVAAGRSAPGLVAGPPWG